MTHPIRLKNRCARVLAFLQERPNVWIEATRFEPLGGRQAWRTALSEARQFIEADGGKLVNQQRRQTDAQGRRWTLSEYLYQPPAEPVQQPLLRESA